MIDIKQIRKQWKEIQARLQTKDPSINLESIFTLDNQINHLKLELEEKKARRNLLSKEIGEKKRLKQDTSALMEEVGILGKEIDTEDLKLKEWEPELLRLLSFLPNLPFEDVKISLDPKDNVCIKTWGEKPSFSFPFKNHLQLNENLHLFDFVRGSKISGSNWPVYCDRGAQLEWALLNYMIQFHLSRGFRLWFPPHLVREETMFGSGQLPKFEKQLFKITDPDYELFLIPTAEVALNGLLYEEILKEEQLPLKFCSYTPCFRREAGAAGSQERGLIRMHQFNKVEMFAFAMPQQSSSIFIEFIQSAEQLLEGLGLHYRTMELVTGDMSFAAAKTVDIEVWLPGQNRYYEVSSVSHCTDFQARRSQIRYKHKEEKPELVHTLNGSGLATSRLMVALLENYQQKDGSVELPLVLQPYLNGITHLAPLKSTL
jgi:seryl-tRNA synthetase